MDIICCDLEGVFIPEIWINVSKKTGIEKLSLTTRDISDYDVLMKMRLEILDENNLKLADIQDVIGAMDPLEGAVDMVNWLKEQAQLIIVSDTFAEFAGPLMKKLGFPTLFCNSLEVDGQGMVRDYTLRQQDGKRHVAKALKNLNFHVIASGDSYNDVTMLQEAHHGILYSPPQNVIDEYPRFPVTRNYEELKKAFKDVLGCKCHHGG
ncbi:bifunctional phosphoserine phosphatase/homoserine phosphotransferase ThrH [Desulfatibacillum aliphaticivorans]|uniref:bifunctional phosphoserine phosphatase/homoserine phosphotransferase ThrH n=1 Tax=Desulfatibacillum aliphaticivorans TaxID=218208 RepID=UPI0004184552|nr:bifunctional phosphoserine phosphatase/homoserine phosphotransferase ThrH [Desulfatibacillum aliphaticivorans]